MIHWDMIFRSSSITFWFQQSFGTHLPQHLRDVSPMHIQYKPQPLVCNTSFTICQWKRSQTVVIYINNTVSKYLHKPLLDTVIQQSYHWKIQVHCIRTQCCLYIRYPPVRITPPFQYLVYTATSLFRSAQHHKHFLQCLVPTNTLSPVIILGFRNKHCTRIWENKLVFHMFHYQAGIHAKICMHTKIDKCFANSHVSRCFILALIPI